MICGIDSLKIEGRKKSYEYVSIVTKIYRKYIDLAKDKSKAYKVEDEDLKQILQIYNRGGMGTGYFENRQDIVYPKQPNHLGIYIGDVQAIFPKRKQVTIGLIEDIFMGDVIRIGENTSYISQMMNGNTVGEIKELKNVKIKDKVYKIVDSSLNKKQWENYKKETKKREISCKLYKNGENLCLKLYDDKICMKTSIKHPEYDGNELDKNRIICQIQKTGNTIFRIKNVDLEVENLKLPISSLNQLRRQAIETFETALENSIRRHYADQIDVNLELDKHKTCEKPKINLFLQKLSKNVDYAKLDYHEIYVPFKELIKQPDFRDCIAVLPNIVDENYEKLIYENKQIFDKVKAVMISHVSQIELLRKLEIKKEMMADNTLNITNNLSEKVLKDLEIKRFTVSPELDKNAINQFSDDLEKELVVYGRTCLMTSKYCPIGKNGDCNQACKNGDYVLKDRKDFVFPVISDCVNCHARIYNSKILSIDYKDINVDFVRIDLLNETEEEIQKIISTVKSGQKFTGENYTNGYNSSKKLI